MKISASMQQGVLRVRSSLNLLSKKPIINQIMRISIVATLLFISCIPVILALPVKAQSMNSELVSVGLKYENLEEALKKIEQQTTLRFYYRNADIKGINNLYIPLETRTLDQLLHQLLHNTFLSFRQIDNSILIEKSVQDKYQITGRVVGLNRQAVNFTTLNLKEINTDRIIQSRTTDTSGYFKILVPRKGTYLIGITAVGMDSISVSVTLSDKQIIDLGEIVMSAKSNSLREVAIVSKKPLIESRIDMTVLNVENSILAAGNSALEILQKAPGVTLDNKQISLRGKSNVLILIDGKPTYLSQDQLNSLLSSIQASSIKSIEIMTNPSAKYDAAGNAGVINIRMKTNQEFGTNISVNLSAGYGNYRKANGGFTLNHKTSLFNFFSNFNYTDNEDFSNVTEYRSVTGLVPTYFNTNFFTKYEYKATNFRVGTDFNIGKQSTLGFIVNGNLFRGNSLQSSQNFISATPGKIDSAIIGSTRGKYPNDYLNYNLNYNTSLDTSGTTLTLSTDYSSSRRNENQSYENYFFDADLTPSKPNYIYRSFMPASIDIYVAKADFVRPIGDRSKLEAGLKYSDVKADNNLSFDNLGSSGYVNDPKRSNHFTYKEAIAAAYLNYHTKFGKYEIQAGLRAERTDATGNSVTDESLVNRTYTDFFPTLFIKRKLDENQSIGVSISRRIDRPDYSALNPFIFYVDQYNYMYGNPYLKPQYTNSFEVNYLLKNKYAISIGYKRTSDVIVWALLTDPETKAIAQTDLNLGANVYYNLNLNVPVSITKWWDTYNNLSVFYNEYQSDAIEGVPFQLKKVAYQYYSGNSFSLGQNSNLELNGSYNSSTVYGVFRLKPTYGIDLGISRRFMEKKLNVKLAVNDIFETMGRRNNYNTFPNSSYNIESRYDSRITRITVSYQFGNSKVKSTDKTGNEEEKRVKKN